MTNYREVIPWYKLRQHLEQQLRDLDSKLRRSQDDNETHRLQGRASVLEDLLNLPETLEILEDEKGV